MKRGRVVIVLAVIAGSLIWVAAKGLTGNLVYYKTPTEILNQGPSAIGERVRVGGLVVPGSVQNLGGIVQFVVTDGTTRLTVINTGSVPALFKDGQGVVVEGTYESDGVFHSDTVLVKHNGVYHPPSPGETPTSADIAGGG
jgi:cytochrome c-type biogenesis protein CcmE